MVSLFESNLDSLTEEFMIFDLQRTCYVMPALQDHNYSILFPSNIISLPLCTLFY